LGIEEALDNFDGRSELEAHCYMCACYAILDAAKESRMIQIEPEAVIKQRSDAEFRKKCVKAVIKVKNEPREESRHHPRKLTHESRPSHERPVHDPDIDEWKGKVKRTDPVLKQALRKAATQFKQVILPGERLDCWNVDARDTIESDDYNF